MKCKLHMIKKDVSMEARLQILVFRYMNRIWMLEDRISRHSIANLKISNNFSKY